MANRHFYPPQLAKRLVSRALDEEDRSTRLGDLEERYQYLVYERGERRARAWYRRQARQLVILAVINHILWSCVMFKNNLVVAWRNIKRNKVFSALNVLGLAAGMASFILIMLFVRYELSYDRYHANARNIYRIIQKWPVYAFGSNVWAVTPAALAPALVQEFPEVRTAARLYISSNILISIGEKTFLESQFHCADPQTFEIFSFPIIRGDSATGLKDPFSVFLSERTARRYFGEADPIGQSIVCHTGNQAFEFRVKAVFRNIQSNSHFIMDIVAPFKTVAKVWKRDYTSWTNHEYYTYVLLKNGTDMSALDSKLQAFIRRPVTKQAQDKHYQFQPLSRIHLHSRANRELSPPGDARFVLLFASIAILVLLIACVNYMNLATARSLKRAKEVGLRKIVGAAKGQLVRQFLGDSIVLTFLALILTVGIVLLVLPAFKTFIEREIVFNPFRDMVLMVELILLAAVVGAVAGSYPAFFVSAFRPVHVLKGTGVSKTKGGGLRHGLIVFQFAASTALIICTVGVRSQLRYIQNRDMGYEREQILVIPNRGGLRTSLEAFKAELNRSPAVLKVSASSSLPNNITGAHGVNWPGKPQLFDFVIYDLGADYEFIDLYGLKLAKGRNFSRDFPSDSGGSFLINETAQKAIGWDEPVGHEFIGRPGVGKIVGVIKDFHMHSLHLPIKPLYIYLDQRRARYISIKIRGENIPATLDSIRKAWERFVPEYPFEYHFFDEIFDRAYRTERRLGTMFSAFAGLAILIACLGLLGLASFAAEQKTKEIGVRKVLGASTSGVIALLSRDFMKWVVLANVLSWPVGYFAMRLWLKNFAYRIHLTVWMFLGSALVAFLIAAIVISLQTHRAALANPVDSLRYE
jgi:putative ABC transport system permease protein